MAPWRSLRRGLRALIHRDATDRDVADEVQDYADHAAAALVARGVNPDDARRAARLELGNMTVAREQVRAFGWENAVETWFVDLRYGLRRLRESPGFTIVSVLTLALGIGASTAIFSAVNRILFEPLPYPNAKQIVSISDAGPGGSPADVTFGNYRELVQRSRSFDALAVLKPWLPTLVGGDGPERLVGQRVSAEYLRVLGVTPALGRDFQAAEDRVNGPNVVVLSDGLWRRRFGGDPALIGRQIKLDDTGYLVIGVMPAGFENVESVSSELWAPLRYSTSLNPEGREWGHHLRMAGRLRPGVTMAGAKRELALIAHAPRPEFARVPWANFANGLIVTSLQADVTRAVRPALLAVLGAVLLMLAIACVNVTNLLLARGAQRRGEFAMRAALGAGRSRLIRQVLTESLLLAIIGGVFGMLVAEFGVRMLVAISPASLPRAGVIHIDGAVLLFGFAVTTVIGLVVGLVPAMQASREDLHVGLQRGSRRSVGDHQPTRRALVVAEVALALVLLVGAGLLLRSLERLFAVPLGFDSSRLLTMQVQETGRRFAADSVRYRFFEQALDAVRRVPGVSTAAFTSQLPLSGDLDGYGLTVDSDQNLGDVNSALRYAATPGFVEAMHIPLRGGRLLGAQDVAAAPRAALINESLAKRKFGGHDPIGRRLKLGPDDGQWYTIVGVVGDVKQTSLDVAPPDAVYVTPTQWHWVDNVMSLIVRAVPQVDVATLTPAIRAAIWSIDKDQPIVRVATMDELLARSAADRRFALVLFETFALVALTLAAIGIYGVLSGSVAERMREIGVRSALGASRGNILSLVIRQGMTLTVIGACLGLLGAIAASRALVTMLFGVSRLDPVTYVGVVVLLLVVSAVACWLPAWRAARVDPAITLRAE